MIHRSLTLLLGAAMLGCGDDPVRILGGACAFGEEHRIAIPAGPRIHDVALVASEHGAWALWSERAGSFARALDVEGAPAGDAVRLGSPCEGGIAALVRDGALVVACGRRGEAAHDDEGGVQVVALQDGVVRSLGAIGAPGPDGSGVSLALGPEGAVHVGWQRAEGAVREAWVGRLDGTTAPERVSSPRARASAPSLRLRGTDMLIAWAETWLDGAGDTQGRLELRVGARAVRSVAELAHEEATPWLGPGAAEGEWLVAFRDRRPRGSRPRVQIASIAPGAASLGPVEAAAHANAEGEARVVSCGTDVFVVAPRTHNRIERLVSVRRHAAGLEPRGPEQQIYEFGAAYEHADATCVDGHLLVIFASNASRMQSESSVRAVAVTCAAAP